jgi:sulfur carrier protein ThiS
VFEPCSGVNVGAIAAILEHGYTGAVQVEVHLHAELVRLAPDSRGLLIVDVPEGARVADLLEQLALGKQRRIIVGLNGESARLDQELTAGARIDLLTPIAGGSACARS